MGTLAVKIKEVHIANNHKLIGNAQVYILTTLIDSTRNKPIIIAMEPFEGVGDNSNLPIGTGGLALYRRSGIQTAPILDFRINIRKSNKLVRELAKALEDFLNQKESQDLIDGCKKLLVNPVHQVIVEVGDRLLSLVMKGLELVKDDLLLEYVDCFEALHLGKTETRELHSDHCNATIEATFAQERQGFAPEQTSDVAYLLEL